MVSAGYRDINVYGNRWTSVYEESRSLGRQNGALRSNFDVYGGVLQRMLVSMALCTGCTAVARLSCNQLEFSLPGECPRFTGPEFDLS